MKHPVHALDPGKLELFLERRRRDLNDGLASEAGLAENLVEVLNRANGFVPSEAGSILLDDPSSKAQPDEGSRLTFLAAFGEKADKLVGREIGTNEGIAGRVYSSGEAYRAANAHSDSFFHRGIDEAVEYETQALVAIPIRIGDSVCGVLELIREQEYSETECQLLEMFAGYLSISIQNVLDARAAVNLAKRDSLTNLYNDRYLHIAVQELLEECERKGSDLAILFLDLDYFKTVNDSHGHLAGSQVLRELGALLEEATASRRALACRYGGDEFVILLADSDLEDALDLAETVRRTVQETTFSSTAGSIQREPLYLGGLSTSIGVATWRHHLAEESAESARTNLLHLADAAMYAAKESGRNRAVVADPAGAKQRVQREVTRPLPPVTPARKS